MALLQSITAQYIVPDSATDPDAESYEYYLRWINPDGAKLQWLFTDFVRQQEVSGQIVNTKTDNINKIYSDANNSVSLVAEDLTENEFDTLVGILRAKNIRRYFKDGSFQELTILTDTYQKQKSQARYRLVIEVVEKESSILR